MVEGYDSMKNYAWEFVHGPEGKYVIGSRCVYTVKYAVDGSVEKYK